MGTPEFAVAALRALMAAGHEIAAAYCQPPRPAGRGFGERRSAVHDAAIELGIAVRTPTTLRDARAQAEFAALATEVAVVAAYGLILPRPILEAPRRGCFNIHASLLPRWRGAAPIQRAIMAGDRESGISIMQMDEGLDTGPVVSVTRVAIGPATTAGSLHDELAALGAGAIVGALAEVASGRSLAQPQPTAGVTYAAKIKKEETRIDWRRPASEVDCHIRGLSPAPGAWFDLQGVRVRAIDSRLAEGSGEPGRVLDDRMTVACGSGAVRLIQVQRDGRRALPADEFLRGAAVHPGDRLG
jgi:methionyl-tRNA formyltransferase